VGGDGVSRVLLLQLDGKLPNVALMRLAAHHRALGDVVTLRHVGHAEALQRGLWDEYDLAYGSLIFTRTRPYADIVMRQFPGILLGGTGSGDWRTLEDLGVTTLRQDYADYPLFAASNRGRGSRRSASSWRILCCSAARAISSFIPEPIRAASSYEYELRVVNDGWTCVEADNVGVLPTGEPYSTQTCRCKDSPRYRSLGNAVAVPCVLWILARLDRVAELEAAA
jgi:hypothetical protein